MTTNTAPHGDKLWASIDQEKRRDRFINRVTYAAWAVTLALILTLGVMSVVSAIHNVPRVLDGQGGIRTATLGESWMSVVSALLPFVAIVGVVSLLIATLATIGVFLRMRTASLIEIQMRLASLEQMLSKSD